jgi:ABC-type ATPase involved in cell division
MDLFRQFNELGTTVIIASHDTGLIQSMQMPTLNLIAGQIGGTTGVSDAQ